MNPVEKVTHYLAQFSLEDRVITLDASSATVALAAQALGCPPALIAKTLSFVLKEGVILLVTAGDAKVDNPKYKAVFGQKPKMPAGDEVEALTGFAPGGVCPFAAKEGVKVYLDVSLKRFKTIYPAGGSGNTAVRLTPAELETASRAEKWVDVCKNWQEHTPAD
ncbi:YbaK/EbsC family protein [Candidatus Avelusimicrobium gallicola]|uniref:EBSC protein n=1 Tax=Candidatus Avelusimicrobium gallicola TaxID=2562704 RepID=A0A1Y4DNU9_9BACT|nr:YbaK/EbsC family protein [Elusimicrobium sp. An273]OUO57071.1 EBSC protein [Elusimicrobium sp. An273]